jgi:hypothetical protein
MINELKMIIDGLKAADVSIQQLHPDLTTPGGKEALRVVLDENGAIKSLEHVDEKKLSDIWVLKKSKQDYFPVVKLEKPLRPEGNKSYVAGLNKKKEKDGLRKACDIQHFLDKYKFINNTTWPKKTLLHSIEERANVLSKSNEKKIGEVRELYGRFLKFAEKGLRILDEKIQEVLNRENISKDLCDLLMAVLFGMKELKKAGKLPDDAKVSVIFDYLPNKENDTFVTSKSNYRAILSEYLISLEQKRSNNKYIGTCPILGNNKVLIIGEKFPEVNLGKGKSVSTVCFYSKYSGNVGETVMRYHKDGTKAYNIDRELAWKFAPTLEKLTADENQKKTWSSILSEGGKQDDLLIAFCHADFNLAITPYICSNSEDDKVDCFDGYLSRASDLSSNLLISNGNLETDPLVDFYVFRKVSKGVQKIIYSNTKGVSSLKKAKSNWITACKNIPNFKLEVDFGKGVRSVAPWSLAPIELTNLSRRNYKANGESLPVPAISFADMMAIFFDIDNRKQSLISSCLNNVVSRWCFLFNLCGKRRILQYTLSENEKKKNREWNISALQSTTIISALLYKLNRAKELYMNDFSYKLGQFFSAIDELHVGYCMDIRGGSIPPVLIGNMAYAVALQDPNKALDILALRLKPYQAWANNKTIDQTPKDQKDEEEEKQKCINSSIIAYKWIKSEKICELLNNKIKHSLLQTHKAELMLGYLAGRPFPANKT